MVMRQEKMTRIEPQVNCNGRRGDGRGGEGREALFPIPPVTGKIIGIWYKRSVFNVYNALVVRTGVLFLGSFIHCR
jgi:hypothetical protein